MMETAREIFDKMIEILNKVKNTYAEIIAQLSLLDREASDIIHIIENSTFNAAKGYLLAKQLKENRIRRRVVKNQKEQLQLLIDNLTGVNFGIIDAKLQDKIRQQTDYIYKPRVLNISEQSNSCIQTEMCELVEK